MEKEFEFSNDFQADWENALVVWTASKNVLSSQVGPRWAPSLANDIVLGFVDHHPNKHLYTNHLLNSDTRIAAYTFKILIRLDAGPKDIPAEVFKRTDTFNLHHHSIVQPHQLGEWISEYYEDYDEIDVHEGDKQAEDWREGPYKQYTQENSEKS